MLISLKAGGVGINLTSASNAFLLVSFIKSWNGDSVFVLLGFNAVYQVLLDFFSINLSSLMSVGSVVESSC